MLSCKHNSGADYSAVIISSPVQLSSWIVDGILKHMSVITLSQKSVQRQKGVVVLPIKEYERLVKSSVPEYYLSGKAAKRLDRLVEEGLRDHRERKTILAGSISEALTKYRK